MESLLVNTQTWSLHRTVLFGHDKAGSTDPRHRLTNLENRTLSQRGDTNEHVLGGDGGGRTAPHASSKPLSPWATRTLRKFCVSKAIVEKEP